MQFAQAAESSNVEQAEEAREGRELPFHEFSKGDLVSLKAQLASGDVPSLAARLPALPSDLLLLLGSRVAW